MYVQVNRICVGQFTWVQQLKLPGCNCFVCNIDILNMLLDLKKKGSLACYFQRNPAVRGKLQRLVSTYRSVIPNTPILAKGTWFL